MENHIVVGTTGTQHNESHLLCITKEGKDVLIDALYAEINDIEKKIQSFSEMGDHGDWISEENDKKLIAEALLKQLDDMRVCER